MKDFFESFEAFFWELWNHLYVYLCEILGGKVNPDWMAPLSEDK